MATQIRILVLFLVVLSPSKVASKGPDIALLWYDQREAVCTAKGESAHSPLYWANSERETWIREKSYYLSRKRICDIEKCDLRDGWIRTSSLSERAAPLYDDRWEDLIIVTTDSLQHIQWLASYLGPSWRIHISVRAEENAHLLICEGGLQENYQGYFDTSCYYIILRGWGSHYSMPEASVIRKCRRGQIPVFEGYRSPKGQCLDSKANNTKPDVISSRRWTLLTVTWQDDSISVHLEGHQGPFLSFRDPDPLRPSQLYVRTNKTKGYWKLHHYTYWQSTRAAATFEVSYPRTVNSRPCLAITYKLPPGATIRVRGLESDSPQLQDDGEWHEVRYVGTEGTSPNPTLTVVTSHKNVAIGDLRVCDPSGDRRILKANTTDGEKLSCTSLVRPAFGLQIHDVERNIKNKNRVCDDGRFMDGCSETCSTLGFRDDCWGLVICLPSIAGPDSVCSCGLGKYGKHCRNNCTSSYYGINCDSQCTQCSGRECHHLWGECSRGCSDIKHFGPFCNQTLPVFSNPLELAGSTYTELKLVLNSLNHTGATFNAIRVMYRKRGDQSYVTAEERDAYPSSPVPQFFTITDLEPGTLYEVISVLRAGSVWTDLRFSPKREFTTKCDDGQFSFETAKDSIKVHVYESTDVHKCSLSLYHVRLEGDSGTNLTERFRENSAVFYNLQPFTTFKLYVNRGSEVVYETEISTLQAAPTQVQDLHVESKTPTELLIRWNPPERANGNITQYNVTYQYISSVSCEKGYHPGTRFLEVVHEPLAHLTGLLPYSKYEISVLARTVEDGPQQVIQNETKAEDRPTHRLEKKSTGQVTHPYSARLTWELQPEKCNDTRGPKRVEVRTSSDDPLCTRGKFPALLVGEGPSVELTGLTPFCNYTSTAGSVSDTNVTDPSLPNVTYKFTTKAAGPPPVTDLEAYSFSSDFIRVRWKPPSPPHGILDRYEVYAMNGVFHTLKKAPELCMIWEGYICATFQGLTREKVYSIEVTAVNKNELKGSTSSIRQVTRERAPSEPVDLFWEFLDARTAQVTWKHPWLPRGTVKRFSVGLHPLESSLKDDDLKVYAETKRVPTPLPKYTLKVPVLPATTYELEVVAYTKNRGTPANLNVTTPVVHPTILLHEPMRIRVTNQSMGISWGAKISFLTKQGVVYLVVSQMDGHPPLQAEDRPKDLRAASALQNGRKASSVAAWVFDVTDMSEWYLPNLLPDTQFNVVLVAVNPEQNGHSTMLLSVGETAEARTTGERSVPSTGSGGAAYAALLLLLLLIPLAFFLYKRYEKSKDNQDMSIPLQERRRNPSEYTQATIELSLSNNIRYPMRIRRSISQTKIHVKVRIAEHELDVRLCNTSKFAVADHCRTENHRILFD